MKTKQPTSGPINLAIPNTTELGSGTVSRVRPCAVKKPYDGIYRTQSKGAIVLAFVFAFYVWTNAFNGVAEGVEHFSISTKPYVSADLGSFSHENMNFVGEIRERPFRVLDFRSPLPHKANKSNAPVISVPRLREPMPNNYPKDSAAKKRKYYGCVWHFLAAALGGFCGFMIVQSITITRSLRPDPKHDRRHRLPLPG